MLQIYSTINQLSQLFLRMYEQLFDDDHVYLELTGFPFEVASSATLSGPGPGRVAIRLPLVWAKKLGLVDA